LRRDDCYCAWGWTVAKEKRRKDVGYTVDVDIGGTLTDGLFSDGQKAEIVKVDTTPHDFTVCFFDCLNEGARRSGFAELASFLEEVDVMRWSSTIATNVMAERKGPKVGLLVSGTAPEHLYGPEPSAAVGFLISPQHLAAVRTPVDRSEVLAATRQLLERGVRRICVSFAGADQDPREERLARAWIEEQYSDHYLGSVPVLLGSDMLRHPDNQTRTHLALINAYVHPSLATTLFKAEDEVLSLRYRHPLYVGHVNGGVARVSKTKAVDTAESGPVFGLRASAHFARAYGFDRVLSLDVGGTTSKIGLIQDGEPAVARTGELFGIGLQIPWTVLHSLSIGGGSVAGVDDGALTLGPESMAAYPGPACYGLGSDRATLTDALLVAGMLNPDRFLGGRRRLDADRGAAAIDADVARPRGVQVPDAAVAVIEAAMTRISDVSRSALDRPAGSTVLFAFGGNGANLAALTADRLGCERAVVFRLGPVFSAFGSSISMVSHVDETWPRCTLGDRIALDRLKGMLEETRQRVLRDVAGEGFDPGRADVRTEVVVRQEDAERRLSFDGEVDGMRAAMNRMATEAGPDAVLERASVIAICPVQVYAPPELPLRPHTPDPVGRRMLAVAGGPKEAAIYDWDALQAGAHIQGPAVLEASANTCTVPVGWGLEVDRFGNGLLARREG